MGKCDSDVTRLRQIGLYALRRMGIFMMLKPILCFGGRSRNMHHLFPGAGALYAEIGPVHGRALGQLSF